MKPIRLTAHLAGLAAFAVSLAACSHPRSDWMMTPQDEPVSASQSSNAMSGDYTPKAEVIFVVDNSDSMMKHIQQVSANIDTFADAFSKNNPALMHIAVVSVYDARTYESPAYQSKFGKTPHAFYHRGEFHQVKGSDGNLIPNKYYISTADPDWKDMLKNTLKVGVQHLNEGGPEFEESFSPVAAAYGFLPPSNSPAATSPAEQTRLIKERQGFFFGKQNGSESISQDDSYKIIFFLTDANDDSPISASEFYADMVQASHDDASKVMAFGAIVPSTLSSRQCPRDPGGKPDRIEDFLRLANPLARATNIASLCGSFGAKFADWGKSIREQVFSQVIPLRDIPVIDNNPSETLHVCYGNRPIPDDHSGCGNNQEIMMDPSAPGMPSPIAGYRYDSNTNSISLDTNLQLRNVPGGKIRLVYTAVSANSIRNGRVNTFMGTPNLILGTPKSGAAIGVGSALSAGSAPENE